MALSTVVVCADLSTNAAAVAGAPCGEAQGLITVQTLLVSPSESPYDAVQASGFFFFGFGVVVFGYLLGFVVGAVRKPIRQGGS
ncbi:MULTISPECIES: hypothetical protein [unclassified Janthinobacterium]|uniref:hypothetical protein n=1 Tax=unclassified Janthinobacterium TaxID=2610881 RepID=UPI0011131273|nr:MULTISPECIES: hypothetical protein [unclassified Janthinobacterium]